MGCNLERFYQDNCDFVLNGHKSKQFLLDINTVLIIW